MPRSRMIKAGSILYHGTSLNPDGEVFSIFDTGYGDWDVVWLVDDENVAARYATRNFSACDPDVPIILEVEILKDMKVADVEKNKRCSEIDVVDLQDPREIYQYVDKYKYDVVKMTGEIDDLVYEDLAFMDQENLKIKRFKTFNGGKWSTWKEIKEDCVTYVDD